MDIKRSNTDSECIMFLQSHFTHTHTEGGYLNLHDVQQMLLRGENRILSTTIASSAGETRRLEICNVLD